MAQYRMCAYMHHGQMVKRYAYIERKINWILSPHIHTRTHTYTHKHTHIDHDEISILSAKLLREKILLFEFKPWSVCACVCMRVCVCLRVSVSV
jgi:hypothetical protein